MNVEHAAELFRAFEEYCQENGFFVVCDGVSGRITLFDMDEVLSVADNRFPDASDPILEIVSTLEGSEALNTCQVLAEVGLVDMVQ